jgi:hypothetical protein
MYVIHAKKNAMIAKKPYRDVLNVKQRKILYTVDYAIKVYVLNVLNNAINVKNIFVMKTIIVIYVEQK